MIHFLSPPKFKFNDVSCILSGSTTLGSSRSARTEFSPVEHGATWCVGHDVCYSLRRWCSCVVSTFSFRFSLNAEASEALGKEQAAGRKALSPCIAHRWELNFSWVKSARRCGLFLKAVNIPLFPIVLKEWNVDIFPKVLRGLLDSFSCLSQDASNSTCPNLNLWFPWCQTGPVLFILSQWTT